jgi:hypothetical protein
VKKPTEDLSVLFTSVFLYTWVDQCRVEGTLAGPGAATPLLANDWNVFDRLERFERTAVLSERRG